jgi:PleD family two-component response regulator
MPQPLARGSVATRPVGSAVIVASDGRRAAALLNQLLSAAPFDVIAVESSAHAYSRIRRMQPAVVVVSIVGDDPGAFQVLSMLAIDEGTRRIPVLIDADAEGQGLDEAAGTSESPVL